MKKAKWTHFWDMHSGGGSKEKWGHIFIESPEEEARIIFFNRFGHNADRVSCTCCGNDYSVSEEDSLEQATAFERNCRFAYFNKEGKEIPENEAWKSGKGMINNSYGKYVEEKQPHESSLFSKEEWDKFKKFIPLKEYIKKENVLIIYSKDIKLKEKKGEVLEQGYVWKD